MLRKLEQRFRHCCMNCEHFEPYGVVYEGEVDCELDDGRTLDKEYYWDYHEENDCEHFKYTYRKWSDYK